MTFCELSHNGAADSFLDDKCTEWAESRYTAMVYTVYLLLAHSVCVLTVQSNMFVLPTDFPLGSHEKFSEFIPGTVL